MNEPADRSVDIALAEFNALRAEILAHTTSQNALLGLGFTAIGVLVGLAINNPARTGLLVIVPVLCGVLLVVYAGLAYRIVVAGSYIRFELWPFLEQQQVRTPGLPSWEASLAALESRTGHHWRALAVEAALSILVVLIGLASTIVAVVVLLDSPWAVCAAVVAGVLLVAAAAVAYQLGGKRSLEPGLLERR